MGGHLDNNSGIYKYTIKPKILEKINTKMNLKAFLKELNAKLIHEGFTDMLGEKKEQALGNFFNGQAKAGEFVDAKDNNNRTGDMFEKKFYLMKKDFATEIELMWQSKIGAKHSPYGWYEFTFDLVNRGLKDVEIVENGNKKTVQTGGWEIRTTIEYKNNIYIKYLNNIPFVKNHPRLKFLYFDKIHGKLIAADENFGDHKLYPFIYKIINKHFKSH